MSGPDPHTTAVLDRILAEVQSLRLDNIHLQARLDRLDASAGPAEYASGRRGSTDTAAIAIGGADRPMSPTQLPPSEYSARTRTISTTSDSPKPQAVAAAEDGKGSPARATSPSGLSAPVTAAAMTKRKSVATSASPYASRVILTTYPGQVGINPINLNWGNGDARVRGPIVASRHPASIRIRNAIGAHGGSHNIYHALSVAIGALPPTHRPDLHNTEPPVKFGPHPQWADGTKIVSMDPFGHMVQEAFSKELPDIDVRPSIAITKAHMRIPEIEEAVKKGRLQVDGKIVLNEQGEIKVTKAAVEPVWFLPGVAARFGVEESVLRRAIFEDTGGMYPELITRPDLKVFMPPIGSLTAYIFGSVEDVSNPDKELTVRVHDECNGSDVFGSDICTCRPYLIYGIEEGVKTAQRGGSGVIVYFRKEGRALGEVTKYLVYNARKRGGDKATEYFQKTENVAGVKDARFQALMPDVLHWLGITKIDNLMSMSNMKYDAIVGSGITVKNRFEIPPELIPPDSRVEIDAKIAAGYFTNGPTVDLDTIQGRIWEDIAH
ncbi:GTP cyclohydrolase N terminal-domain-containing protein [Blastocladiella britannica]|nr:GTP cyclohydrolase N terminal-domain-containing protein [Blastocladiella britannica]